MKDINDLIIDENYIDYKEDFEILSEWTVDPKKKLRYIQQNKLLLLIRIFILEKRNIMKLRNVNCLLDIITLVAYQSIKNFIQNSKVLLLM